MEEAEEDEGAGGEKDDGFGATARVAPGLTGGASGRSRRGVGRAGGGVVLFFGTASAARRPGYSRHGGIMQCAIECNYDAARVRE